MLHDFDIVNKYLGLPYLHRGRGMDGLDCWGLIKLIYKDIGHELYDVENYDENWAKNGAGNFFADYHKQWDKAEKPDFLDVVLFINTRGIACHAGVYIKEGMMLHSSNRHGVVMARVRNDKRIFDGFYRLKITK